jgi:hypothetical protein
MKGDVGHNDEQYCVTSHSKRTRQAQLAVGDIRAVDMLVGAVFDQIAAVPTL